MDINCIPYNIHNNTEWYIGMVLKVQGKAVTHAIQVPSSYIHGQVHRSGPDVDGRPRTSVSTLLMIGSPFGGWKDYDGNNSKNDDSLGCAPKWPPCSGGIHTT